MNKDCMIQAQRFLAIREHNRQELTNKLQNRNFSKADIVCTIDCLENANLFSERRYVESFVNSNNGRHPMGKSVVLQKLLAKGADRHIASEVLDEIYTDEYVASLIKTACAKLLKRGKTANAQTLSKLGFPLSKIREYIDNANMEEL